MFCFISSYFLGKKAWSIYLQAYSKASSPWFYTLPLNVEINILSANYKFLPISFTNPLFFITSFKLSNKLSDFFNFFYFFLSFSASNFASYIDFIKFICKCFSTIDLYFYYYSSFTSLINYFSSILIPSW